MMPFLLRSFSSRQGNTSSDLRRCTRIAWSRFACSLSEVNPLTVQLAILLSSDTHSQSHIHSHGNDHAAAGHHIGCRDCRHRRGRPRRGPGSTQEGPSERCARVVAGAQDVRVRDLGMDERIPRTRRPWSRRHYQEQTRTNSGVQLYAFYPLSRPFIFTPCVDPD
jgi:hypothetical protein